MQIHIWRPISALSVASLRPLPLGVALLSLALHVQAQDVPGTDNPSDADTPTAASPADAPPETPVTELETIIVRSSPFGLTADELVRPVDVLSGEALERRRRGTIGDVLADRPGVSNSSFGPGVGRPVIRGQGGPRVLVLDNGISTMDASSISADHAVSIDPLGADQIEVIKGPATLIYGGSASAGVVNVVDDRLPEQITHGLRLRSDLSYGSNADERTGALRARYGAGNWQWGGDYSRREAGEFSIPGYATRLTEDQIAGVDHEHEHSEEDEVGRWNRLENSDLQTERYGLSGAWAGPRGMLGAAVTRFETLYGIPGHSHGHEDAHDHEAGGEHDHDEGHSHEGVRIDLEQTRVDLRGVLNDPFEAFERLEARVGVNDYQHAEIEPDGGVGTMFDVQETDLRTELAHRPAAGWAGVGGVQVTHRDFEAVGAEAFVPPVVTRGGGVFLVEGREFGHHRLELGARIDRVSHSADDPGTGIDPAALRSNSYLPVSLSADIAFMLDEHLHLRFNVQQAQRAPAAEEVYAFGPHLATLSFERGDVDLEVETANNFEVSLGRDRGRWTWALAAYYNRISDYIYLQEVDQGLNADGSGTVSSDGEADRVDEEGGFAADGELLLVDVVQNDAEFYGLEGQVGFAVIDRGPLRLDLNAFGDTVHARLVEGGDALPRIPPVRLGLGADARIGALSGGIRYMRAQKHDRTASLETFTPGYDLLSADIAFAPTLPGLLQPTFYIQGRNLLDEKIRLSSSFLKDVAPQPGRSIFVGIRVDFDATR